MSPDGESALVFLAPGLLHRFGNTLFAVHGRARLLRASLDEPSPPLDLLAEDARAVVDDADAAMRALSVLRWLAGEDAEELVALGALLDDVLEVARVPLRDARVVVTADCPNELLDALVRPQAILGALCLGLRALGAPRDADESSMRLTVARTESGAELRLPAAEPVPPPWRAVPESSSMALAILLHDQP